MASPLDAEGADRVRLLGVRARTLTTLALTEFLLEGRGAAEARFAEAETIIDALGDPRLRARLAYQRANVAGRVGDLAAARAGLDAALASPEAFTPKERCSVLLSRGMLAFEMAEPAVALDAFSSAASLALESGSAELEFMARHNAGYAAYLLGDLPGALATMRTAATSAPDVSMLPAQLDRAHVLLEAGLIDESVSVLDDALASLDGNRGTDQGVAELQLRLCRAHRLAGRLGSARAAGQLAVSGFGQLGADGWEAKAQLALAHVDLEEVRRSMEAAPTAADGTARRSRERATALVRTADKVAGTADRLGDLELRDAAVVTAADASAMVGDLVGARRRLERCRPESVSLTGELDQAAVRAAVHVACGENAEARHVLRRAARSLGAAQQGSASLDLRTARAIHGVRLARSDLSVALRLGSAAVLESLDRWRSATDRLPTVARPADPELAALTEQLRTTRALQREGPEGAAARELDDRVLRLEREIRARDWTLSNTATDVRRDQNVHDGREALRSGDRDLLWFFPHSGRLMAVGIVGGRARVRDLTSLGEATELAHRLRVDLRTAASRDLGPFADAVRRSLQGAARRLDELLVRPWGLRARGLVLVTCEEVSALPWALLPSLRGRPLTLSSSLSSFSRREESHALRARTKVHVSVGPGVPRAQQEGRRVRESWGRRAAEVVVCEPSTPVDLLAAMRTDHVVHVAAHGTHHVQSPLFSSVHLHDGPVFAHELQVSGVHADHVVLAACDVGSATFRPGEEQLGLAAAILSLGARSVVAAVSPVPDVVAAEVMSRHHAALARGVPSDEALADAVAAGDVNASTFLHLGGRFLPA